MSSNQRQSSIRVSFDGLDAFSLLWSELVDRTDVDEIILHIIGNYQLSKLSLKTANDQRLALSKLIRSFHSIWQMQMLHVFSSPRFWHGKHKLYLLSPERGTASIQYLIQAVTEVFDQYGGEFGLDAGYAIMTHVYEVVFYALRAMLLSPFELQNTTLEPLEEAICSAALSDIYNHVLPSQREAQGAADDNILTYLKKACHAILYHLNDRNNEESKSLIQFTRDLNVGYFTESNDPQANNQILAHLSSLEGTQSLEQEGSNPPNFKRFCQMYDIYLAVLGICGNHKAKRRRNRTLIDPPTLEFARKSLTKFQAVAAKVPLSIQKPVFRLASSLGRYFSPPVNSRNADYFTSQQFYGDFRSDLQKRSNMLTLSEPCYTTFRKDVGNVFQNIAKVDGTQAPLTSLVDDSIPFAISNCSHSHIHSQGGRRHIETTTSAAQKYCHICTYAGDDARITGWREVKELTRVHTAFLKLRNNINQIINEQLSELPKSRLSAAEPFPRISPPASTPNLGIQAQELSRARSQSTPEAQERDPFQGAPSTNGDALGQLRAAREQRGSLSPHRHQHSASVSGQVLVNLNLPSTPPSSRSDGSSPAPPSPALLPANHPANPFPSPFSNSYVNPFANPSANIPANLAGDVPANVPPTTPPNVPIIPARVPVPANARANIPFGIAFNVPGHNTTAHTSNQQPSHPPSSYRAANIPANPIEQPSDGPAQSTFKEGTVPTISSSLAKFTRRHLNFGISRGPSLFGELLTDKHRDINPTCAFSRNCKQALFWSKAYLGMFSVTTPAAQGAASGDTPTLKCMHKYPGISLDWARPILDVSDDVFAFASLGDTTTSKVCIYRLSSSQLRKEIPIEGFISNLAVSPDDSLVAVGTCGKSVQIFHTNESKDTREVKLPSMKAYKYEKDSKFQRLSFCNSGKNLVVASVETVYARASGAGNARGECKVHVWIASLQSSEKPELWKAFDAPYAYDPGDQGITSVIYNPTRDLVCVTFWTTSEEGNPCLVHKSPDRPVHRIRHNHLQPKIQAAAFSPSGSLLVLVSADGLVFKINLANNFFVTKLEGTVEMANRPGESVQLRITDDSRTALVLSHDTKYKAEIKSFSLMG